jgi:hypothetical protein
MAITTAVDDSIRDELRGNFSKQQQTDKSIVFRSRHASSGLSVKNLTIGTHLG